MNWQNCFELFECVWPFCGIVAEVWDCLLTQPVAIDQNANRAFLNIRKTCSNSRTKTYMTSKSCGNDVITIIYDFIFDFLIFTGSGDLWKAIFLREYNSNLFFIFVNFNHSQTENKFKKFLGEVIYQLSEVAYPF